VITWHSYKTVQEITWLASARSVYLDQTLSYARRPTNKGPLMNKGEQLTADSLALTTSLAKAPTIEQYKKVMGPFWNYSINTILYLREFEIGFQAATFLLNLTAHYKSQLTNKEYQINKYMLLVFLSQTPRQIRLLGRTDINVGRVKERPQH
jgi:hypothetical protein